MRSTISAIVVLGMLAGGGVSRAANLKYVLLGKGPHGYRAIAPDSKLEYFQLERRGGTVIVKLENPPVNAVSERVAHEWMGLLMGLDADPTAQSIILTGYKNQFAAGGDLKTMAQADARKARQVATDMHNLLLVIQQMGKAVIAAINGHALGGGSQVVLSADERIAANLRNSEGTPVQIIGQPEINLGTIPGWGGTQRLPRLIGTKAAVQAILSGQRYTAEEAKALGWVDRVVEPEKLLEVAVERAKIYEGKRPGVIAADKRRIYGIKKGSAFMKALEDEINEFANRFATGEPQQDMQKFLDRSSRKK